MIAAKAFDPVLGVDIHIVQPPGPVPPIPVPHPFVGMLIDPFDFAPIIGATVMINGLPRATAGTGGKCIPPHIPIGGVFVKPPANECDVFMGSATVLADGDPLSRLGMPALSCHCVGMPPIPRIKKKRRVMSLVLPTTVVLAVPMGMPVLVGGPPTISMMALGMKAGLAVLGKLFKKLRALQKASRRIRAISDRIQNAASKAMNKLGIPPSVQNRVSRAICSVTGHPVDVATGKVFTDAVDVEVGGTLPFKWERVWFSSSTYRGPLGHGWHHSYDMALIVDGAEGTVALRMADGRPVSFPALPDGGSATDAKERLTLFRDTHDYGIRTADGLEYRFAGEGGPAEPRPLSSIEDRNRNALNFTYDVAGRLTAITDSAGRAYSVESDDRGRILVLWTAHPRNPRERVAIVSYAYDENGNLVQVKDAAGQATRYEYRGPLLVRETDRAGFSFYFEYDGDSSGARCIRTYGDDGLFARTLTYGVDEGRTIVTDGDGHVMTYVWNAAGVVEQVVGPYGETLRYVWDDNNNLVQQIDALGRSVASEFDEWGNKVRVIDAAGGVTETKFEGGLLREQLDPSGARWQYEYDERGNLLAQVNPLGRSRRYRNNSRGLPVAIEDAQGRSHLEWNERGDLVAFRDRAGGRTEFSYDGWGRLALLTDAIGRRRAYEYDAMSRLTQVAHPDGSVERFGYDSAGRLTSYIDPLGAKREFKYRFGDRPIERIDEGIRRTQFAFDRENRLVGILNANGSRYLIQYHANDNVLSETGFDGRTRTYEYNAAGQLIRCRERGTGADAVEIETSYLRDELGRLVKKIQPDAVSTFAYDRVGRLLRAVNPECHVSFTYDAVGNLLLERQGEQSVVHRYDDLGNRTQTTYPTGEVVQFDYAAVGVVTGVALNGRRVVTREHDAIHRERKRSQGAVDSSFDYDPAGRLQRQVARHGSTVLISRQYAYDASGRLTTLEDAADGSTTMTYDALGRLSQVLGRQAREVLAFDPADNLTDAGDSASVAKRPDDRLVAYRGIRFEYDSFGNVTAKRHLDGGSYRFRYDSEHRLVEVRSEKAGVESTTAYRYDALGRRIAKTTNDKEITFVWSANRLLQERRGGQVSSYIYGPREMVPLATWNGTGLLHFHCDHLGTPRELTSHDTGQIVWRSAARLWEKGGASGEVDQHFRYQGQYYDPESGLHYNRFRYFDPDVGRYLTQDPVGLAGGLNPYSYAPDPVNFTDPLGLRWIELGDDWTGRIDQFTTGGSASHEIHIYDHTGREVGVVGPEGEWIPKHGHPATKPPEVSIDMARRINGHNVDQLRREGHVVDRPRSRSMYQRTCGN